MRNKNEHIQYFSIKKQISIKKMKQTIFNGKILIFKDFPQIKEINDLSRLYFKKIFKEEFNIFLNEEEKKNYFFEKQIVNLQKKIKSCKLIKKSFSNFLGNIKFDISDTFCDQITLRFSPQKKSLPVGLLKPVEAHRDTWASNIFHQINWWFPLHNVSNDNSIYIVPYYFNRKIKNNSCEWSFELFKKKHSILSTPISKKKLGKYKKIRLNIKSGEILCFSGNHLHGSTIGLKKRLNLETRTICSNDPIRYKIPANIDSKSKIKKNSWFKSLLDNSIYQED